MIHGQYINTIYSLMINRSLRSIDGFAIAGPQQRRTVGMAMSKATSVPRQSASTPSRLMILRMPSMVEPYAEHSGPRHSCAAAPCSGLGHVVEQPSSASFLQMEYSNGEVLVHTVKGAAHSVPHAVSSHEVVCTRSNLGQECRLAVRVSTIMSLALPWMLTRVMTVL